jgi:hypothetical protein
MAGGDKVAVQGIGPFEQRPPFDMRIAHHAWIGGAAGQVFLNKIFDHEIPEFFPDIQYKMRETMVYGSGASVIEGVQVAATRLFFTPASGGIIPCFHGNAHHFIPFMVKHERGYGTVYTPAHGYHYFSLAAHFSGFCKDNTIFLPSTYPPLWKKPWAEGVKTNSGEYNFSEIAGLNIRV